MKIVCGACSAKYSVADEKVRGRAVKIRCKKCGDAIIVRGDAEPAELGVWHVVVGEEQRSALAPAEVGALIASGTIGWDAYVWREGFAEWKPAEDVEELVDAIMGGRAPERAAGGDLFATESQSLFAGDEPSSDDETIASSSTTTARADSMTGARNESSVLFSLANLSALGASAPKNGPAATASATPRAMASGEGSGLIDIRALASATGLGAPAAHGPAPAARVDDLLGLGGPALALGSALAPPVLITPNAPASRGGSALILAAAIVAVGLLGGASALAYVSVGPGTRPAPITPPAPTLVLAPPTPPAETTTPIRVAAVDAPTREVETPEAVLAPTRPSHRPTPLPVATHEAPPVTPTTTPTATTAQHERDLDSMIEQAVFPGTHEPRVEHRTPATDPSLPVTPARADIMSAMSRVSSAVTACGGGEHGIATVRVTMTGATGHATNAVVSGPFAGTPVGSCIALAVRGATVPPFSQSTFSLSYPFRI